MEVHAWIMEIQAWSMEVYLVIFANREGALHHILPFWSDEAILWCFQSFFSTKICIFAPNLMKSVVKE